MTKTCEFYIGPTQWSPSGAIDLELNLTEEAEQRMKESCGYSPDSDVKFKIHTKVPLYYNNGLFEVTILNEEISEAEKMKAEFIQELQNREKAYKLCCDILSRNMEFLGKKKRFLLTMDERRAYSSFHKQYNFYSHLSQMDYLKRRGLEDYEYKSLSDLENKINYIKEYFNDKYVEKPKKITKRHGTNVK